MIFFRIISMKVILANWPPPTECVPIKKIHVMNISKRDLLPPIFPAKNTLWKNGSERMGEVLCRIANTSSRPLRYEIHDKTQPRSNVKTVTRRKLTSSKIGRRGRAGKWRGGRPRAPWRRRRETWWPAWRRQWRIPVATKGGGEKRRRATRGGDRRGRWRRRHSVGREKRRVLNGGDAWRG